MPLYNPLIFVQSVFTEITVDTTSTTKTFADLLTGTIIVGLSNQVIATFTCSVTNNAFAGASIAFQLLVDGTPARGLGVRAVNSATVTSGALVYQTGALTAGSHTFKIQWLMDVGTSQIRPVTSIVEHASLLLCEVSD